MTEEVEANVNVDINTESRTCNIRLVSDTSKGKIELKISFKLENLSETETISDKIKMMVKNSQQLLEQL